MIDKEKVLKYFIDDEKDKVVKIIDKINLSYNRDIPVCTNEFYTPKVWSYFTNNSFGNIEIKANGIFEEAERRIISIKSNYDMECPISVLKIENKSSFNKLNHKDYLGAILSLGIKREKIGDVIVDDSCAYVVCLNDIADYIMYNLSQIAKSKVEINIIYDFDNLPKISFKEEVVNVASMRIDSIVAKIANVSRNKSIEMLSSGKVLVNYSQVRDKSIEVKDGMRITIRGEGKFIVGAFIGETKSGKKKIIIKKYC